MKTLLNKTRIGIALLTVSVALIASGCAAQTESSPSANASTNASSSPENSPANGPANGPANDVASTQAPVSSPSASPSSEEPGAQEQQNPFAVAGIEDPEKFNELFRTVQDLVAKNDKEKLADYVLYPLNVFTPDKNNEQVKDREGFIANYDRIFTKSVKENLQNQKIEDLFANWQGVSTEGGVLWFGVREGGLVGIMTVNQPA